MASAGWSTDRSRSPHTQVPGTQPLDLDDLHAQLGNITRIVPV